MLAIFKSGVEKQLEEKVDRLEEKIIIKEDRVRSAEVMIHKLEDKIKDLTWKLDHVERNSVLETQEKLNSLKSDMKKSLIDSDLARIEATSKLEVYEKIDTKADANIIKETVGKLVEALGKNQKQDISVIK